MIKNVILAVVAIGAVAGGLFYARQSGEASATRPAAAPEKPALFKAEPAAAGGAAAPVEEKRTTKLHFVEGTAKSGVWFRHLPTRSPERYMPEIMGGGVIIADFNRDGAPDLVCANSGSLLTGGRPAEAGNKLFLNNGKGMFRDETTAWGLPSVGYGMGGTAGDYNNDGWPDLLLTGFGGALKLLKNTGSGFVDVTEESGIGQDERWSTSAGFFDMDHDGDLDLYVARYIDYTLENALRCYAQRIHIYCTPVLYDPVPDRLLRNNGDGTFTDISEESGFNADPCKGLAIAIGDADLDGDEDVYVANDTSRNFLLINDGTGKFEEIGRISGTAYSEFGAEEAGMGADFSDFNADSKLDIVVTNFQSETTSIYRQGERMFYREVSDAVGVGETARARLSFGVDFFDADNDGDEDLLVANGHIEDNIGEYRKDVSFEQANTLYENTGNGRLEDVTEMAGPALADRQVSRGLATSDLDGDGDLDYVIGNNGGTTQIGINQTADIGNFVGLWLEGRKANRSAIGAKVEARFGERCILRQVQGAQSFLSLCDFRVHLGLGEAERIDELTIRWPGGEAQVLRDVAAGKYYYVREGDGPVVFVPGERTIEP